MAVWYITALTTTETVDDGEGGQTAPQSILLSNAQVDHTAPNIYHFVNQSGTLALYGGRTNDVSDTVMNAVAGNSNIALVHRRRISGASALPDITLDTALDTAVLATLCDKLAVVSGFGDTAIERALMEMTYSDVLTRILRHPQFGVEVPAVLTDNGS